MAQPECARGVTARLWGLNGINLVRRLKGRRAFFVFGSGSGFHFSMKNKG